MKTFKNTSLKYVTKIGVTQYKWFPKLKTLNVKSI